ncbi:MAG TPA: hypothetical protein VN328_04885 [Thermodesulfovibrionales bacterium]|nr:hypothetical protein [Thermodesulfovibrionales bacterium]
MSRKAYVGMATCVLMLAGAALSLTDKTFVIGSGIREDVFPDRAIAFLDKNNIQGRMFNSYGLGGYIIWHAPERKVFIDGRNRRLYSTDLDYSYLEMFKKHDAWKEAENRWGFDYVLLEYNPRTKSFPKHLMENMDWALVYWDNHSIVYLKRIEKNLPVIETYEYKVTKPTFYDFSYLDAYLHSGVSPQLIRDIDREILLNPSNQEPRLAKVFLLYNMGKSYYDEALKELEICQTLKPDLSMNHSALAYILFEKGLIDRAKDEVKKALELDPEDPGANYLKDKL